MYNVVGVLSHCVILVPRLFVPYNPGTCLRLLFHTFFVFEVERQVI